MWTEWVCWGGSRSRWRRTAIDLLTVSANDLCGPPGVGALWIRPGLDLAPQVVGGGQEGGFRSGTENLAGAVGLGVAAEFAFREGPAEAARRPGAARPAGRRLSRRAARRSGSWGRGGTGCRSTRDSWFRA